MKNKQKSKDMINCDRYISKMRLTGVAPKNSFFSNLAETYIGVDMIALADDLNYPEILKIPSFVSSIMHNYITDDEFDFSKIKNVKRISLSDRIPVDDSLIASLRRFTGLKELSLTEEQYNSIVEYEELRDKYKYDIRVK